MNQEVAPTRSPVLTLPRLGLHLFSVITTLFAWLLIWLGGLVTSKEAGMSVPDWPNTFGYNMFLFPISRWTGLVFYEHSHRILASFVGLCTVVLLLLLFVIEKRAWVKQLGFWLLIMVIAQGVLGGLRVSLAKDFIGIFHGCLAQAFLATLASVSVFTSPWWERVALKNACCRIEVRPAWLRHVTMMTVVIFLQLTVAASMRHAHAGLAIPDFPTAYGAIWPHVTHEQLISINEARVAAHQPPTSLAQIHLQMLHRLLAVIIVFGILASFFLLLKQKLAWSSLHGWNLSWSIFVLLQFFLGAMTIWSGKAADIATLHVAVGAFLLTAGVIQIIMVRRLNQVASPNPQPCGSC